MTIYNSPLRYPGGKASLSSYIEKVIQVNEKSGCQFIEPYAGGASISIALLQKGVIGSSILIERDPLLYSFWKAVFDYTYELCTLIEDTDINIDTWNRLCKNRNIEIPISTKISELGFAALFLNRTNFSGILKAGPIGGQAQEGKYKIDCRFNKRSLIKTISFLSLYRDRVEVVWSDGLSYLKSNRTSLSQKNSFAYIDPPYYAKGKSLYRYYFDNNDHIQLANHIKTCQYPWLLSYDNCVFINNLYNNNLTQLNRRTLYFDYSAGKSKKEKELLISNLEIPPLELNEFEIEEYIL